MSEQTERNVKYELVALRYLDAMDNGDLDAIAELWREAETDPELERIFCEMNEGLAEETGIDPRWAESKATVTGLLEKHFPGAVHGPADGDESDPPPLTAGQVAARMMGDVKIQSLLSATDREVNSKLLTDRTPIPATLGAREMMELTRVLPVAAGQKFWRAFQQAAVMMQMSRGRQEAARAAARQAARGKPRPRGDGPSKAP